MKQITPALFLAAFSALFLSACNSSGGDTDGDPVYNCPQGYQAYLEIVPESGFAVTSDEWAIGSAQRMNVNTSDEDTLLLNIGFASGDLSYSLLVLVPGPTGTGTYHFADLDNIVFLWENGAGTCTDMTLTISELGELLYSPFLPAGNMY